MSEASSSGGVESWARSEWGARSAGGMSMGVIVVRANIIGTSSRFLDHEDQIEAKIPGAPDAFKRQLRKYIRAHRPEAENETRGESGKLYTMRVVGNELEYSWEENGHKGVAAYTRGDLSSHRCKDQNWVKRGLAYFDKHRPLAVNETVACSGKRGTMSIETAPYKHLRPRLIVQWGDGSQSSYRVAELDSQGGDWARRKTFYEANAPVPIEVTVQISENEIRDYAFPNAAFVSWSDTDFVSWSDTEIDFCRTPAPTAASVEGVVIKAKYSGSLLFIEVPGQGSTLRPGDAVRVTKVGTK